MTSAVECKWCSIKFKSLSYKDINTLTVTLGVTAKCDFNNNTSIEFHDNGYFRSTNAHVGQLSNGSSLPIVFNLGKKPGQNVSNFNGDFTFTIDYHYLSFWNYDETFTLKLPNDNITWCEIQSKGLSIEHNQLKLNLWITSKGDLPQNSILSITTPENNYRLESILLPTSILNNNLKKISVPLEILNDKKKLTFNVTITYGDSTYFPDTKSFGFTYQPQYDLGFKNFSYNNNKLILNLSISPNPKCSISPTKLLLHNNFFHSNIIDIEETKNTEQDIQLKLSRKRTDGPNNFNQSLTIYALYGHRPLVPTIFSIVTQPPPEQCTIDFIGFSFEKRQLEYHFIVNAKSNLSSCSKLCLIENDFFDCCPVIIGEIIKNYKKSLKMIFPFPFKPEANLNQIKYNLHMELCLDDENIFPTKFPFQLSLQKQLKIDFNSPYFTDHNTEILMLGMSITSKLPLELEMTMKILNNPYFKYCEQALHGNCKEKIVKIPLHKKSNFILDEMEEKIEFVLSDAHQIFVPYKIPYTIDCSHKCSIISHHFSYEDQKLYIKFFVKALVNLPTGIKINLMSDICNKTTEVIDKIDKDEQKEVKLELNGRSYDFIKHLNNLKIQAIFPSTKYLPRIFPLLSEDNDQCSLHLLNVPDQNLILHLRVSAKSTLSNITIFLSENNFFDVSTYNITQITKNQSQEISLKLNKKSISLVEVNEPLLVQVIYDQLCLLPSLFEFQLNIKMQCDIKFKYFTLEPPQPKIFFDITSSSNLPNNTHIALLENSHYKGKIIQFGQMDPNKTNEIFVPLDENKTEGEFDGEFKYRISHTSDYYQDYSIQLQTTKNVNLQYHGLSEENDRHYLNFEFVPLCNLPRATLILYANNFFNRSTIDIDTSSTNSAVDIKLPLHRKHSIFDLNAKFKIEVVYYGAFMPDIFEFDVEPGIKLEIELAELKVEENQIKLGLFIPNELREPLTLKFFRTEFYSGKEICISEESIEDDLFYVDLKIRNKYAFREFNGIIEGEVRKGSKKRFKLMVKNTGYFISCISFFFQFKIKINILLFGWYGSGKSSFINSLLTAVQDPNNNVPAQSVQLGRNGKHGTKALISYEPQSLNCRICDTKGLSMDNYKSNELKDIVEAKRRSGWTYSDNEKSEESDSIYKQHCIIFFLTEGDVQDPNLTHILRMMGEINELNIPLLFVLSKCDRLDSVVIDDLSSLSSGSNAINEALEIIKNTFDCHKVYPLFSYSTQETRKFAIEKQSLNILLDAYRNAVDRLQSVVEDPDLK